MLRRHSFILSVAVLAAALGGRGVAHAEDKVSFITNWTAEAEHGGFYQALAAGIYKRHGLDVTLRQGGPSMNTQQMLAAGAVDLRMGASSGDALNYVKEGVPAVVVAAIFQKEPSILMAHPRVGNDSLAALKGKPIAISRNTIDTWWKFLVAKFGYTDSQIRPYTFNNAPFLVDKTLVQQGYLTSEPYAIEKEGGFKPVVFLLADDAGYASYATTIDATVKLVKEKPDVVKRFVEGYMEAFHWVIAHPKEAVEITAKDNPEYADKKDVLMAQLESDIKSTFTDADTTKYGLGYMTKVRWEETVKTLKDQGVLKAPVKLDELYTDKFLPKMH